MNSTNTALDDAILAVLRSSDGVTNFKILSDDRVIQVLVPLAERLGKDDFRILDARLQALKKTGQIRYEGSKKGWVYVPDGRPLLTPVEQEMLNRLRQRKVLRWVDLSAGGVDAQILNRLVKKGWASVHEDSVTVRRWEIAG